MDRLESTDIPNAEDMNLKVEGMEMMVRKKLALAAFGRPLDAGLVYSRDNSYTSARSLAEGGMGWIWSQWLMQKPVEEIVNAIDPFIERGMQIQDTLKSQRMKGLHDLFLLHCAIFACNDAQLIRLAKKAVDASSMNAEAIANDGNLYATAWCGMLKHWVLDNREEAFRQSEIIWKSYKPPYFKAAPKALVTAWLSGDWKRFVAAQKKDFHKLWERAQKDGTVSSKSRKQTTVQIADFSVAQLWCWAHCGMGLLAYRQGVEISTDPFWFPSHALKVVDHARQLGQCQFQSMRHCKMMVG